ncbi:ATP-binding protein [Streptomyces sp. S465]|uniref:ATP-binding protein n=1 Tax=Streptomyces sp. S465 TaxID=2979468 RepID=UPI0022A8D124|nr:ATP-binding protein [Streptomyces sp. S465]WAP57668.1 ATP-binding protein [Streptomyces sp. S465]
MDSDHESDDRPPPRPPVPPKDPYVYTLQSSRQATSAKVCRDFVACVLNSVGQEELVEVATLCTSELATNAFLHAEGDSVMLRVVIESPRFRVLVYDASAELPTVARLPGGDRLYGRGLGLVAALVDGWGTAEGDAGGTYAKGVWFELVGTEEDEGRP